MKKIKNQKQFIMMFEGGRPVEPFEIEPNTSLCGDDVKSLEGVVLNKGVAISRLHQVEEIDATFNGHFIVLEGLSAIKRIKNVNIPFDGCFLLGLTQLKDIENMKVGHSLTLSSVEKLASIGGLDAGDGLNVTNCSSLEWIDTNIKDNCTFTHLSSLKGIKAGCTFGQNNVLEGFFPT